MAAYAALVSLMNTMDQILNHPRFSTSLHTKQTESLGELLDFFLHFVEGYNSHGDTGKQDVEYLESRIASTAHAAEYVIESRVVDQIHGKSTEESCSFLMNLQKIIENMESIKERVIRVEAQRECRDQLPIYSKPATSSRPLITGKNAMVGFEDGLIQLIERLTTQRPNRKIIPIVGMGGIGKTTLAINVYENLVIVQYFDIRVWITISQQRSAKEILLELLQSVKNSGIGRETDEELGEKLYKTLCGKRYLIVLDDLWNIDVWDKIKCFFPNNSSNHGFLVTTRLSMVANHFGSQTFVMNFLDEDTSWSLFCEKAFGQEGCPLNLEGIGKTISRNCRGLPLAIVVMGGLLRNSYRTQQHWENVANEVNPFLGLGEDEQCLNILSLSYTHLPVYLRPCFLYIGIGHETRVSQLIKLWVAEGFLKPNKSQSAEEVAENYLKDLVDRHLIMVHRIRSNGEMKTVGIHDFLKELCLRIARKENFLCVKGNLEPPFRLRKLKVFNFGNIDFRNCTLEHANLRFIKYSPNGFSLLPCSISLLWNVQTLIIKQGRVTGLVAPSEIWNMRQIRHLEFDDIYFLDPSSKQADIILLNLQTLLTVVNFRLSEEVCKRIPNVKKLFLKYTNFPTRSHFYCLHNLGCFHRLVSLNCYFKKMPNRGDLLHNFTLPSSLQKLSLTNCGLHWEDLTIIGLLQQLQVLKLGWNSVTGYEWNLIEGEFLRLKFLSIHACSDLIYWNADSSHFPVLEKLVLNNMYQLDEIPSGIGELATLRVIRLEYCSVSTIISTIKILEEQESLGNDGLQVGVAIWDDEELEKLKENMELESFPTSNFQLKVIGGNNDENDDSSGNDDEDNDSSDDG